jgi:hypothetical protein
LVWEQRLCQLFIVLQAQIEVLSDASYEQPVVSKQIKMKNGKKLNMGVQTKALDEYLCVALLVMG